MEPVMLDHISLKLAKPLLESTARRLATRNISADQVSVLGFMMGVAGAATIGFQYYIFGMVLILLNRLADGIDGALARIKGATDRGAYLDICLDFIFYSAVVFGFAVADPTENSLAAAALIFSFVGTGSSFLAYAIMAERRKLTNLRLPNKGFYYLGGLAEGTETILFFVLFCLFPGSFTTLAWILTAICWLSTFLRIISSYTTLTSNNKPSNGNH
jgi:phosphatidylglycerophosphate synthase